LVASLVGSLDDVAADDEPEGVVVDEEVAPVEAVPEVVAPGVVAPAVVDAASDLAGSAEEVAGGVVAVVDDDVAAGGVVGAGAVAAGAAGFGSSLPQPTTATAARTASAMERFIFLWSFCIALNSMECRPDGRSRRIL
jgi:hypothetical protein